MHISQYLPVFLAKDQKGVAAAAFIAGLRPPGSRPKEACCCIHRRAEAG
jgi:hypothetical protein